MPRPFPTICVALSSNAKVASLQGKKTATRNAQFAALEYNNPSRAPCTAKFWNGFPPLFRWSMRNSFSYLLEKFEGPISIMRRENNLILFLRVRGVRS
jgi:hypothetical protein